MKKVIEGLDLEVYSKKLDNGLEIYIVPDNNVNNTYVTYSTKYGSMHNEFIPFGEKKMIEVPKGIAHFLEHKMFEQESGEDVFSFFSARGSGANANTNYRKTTYLFSGPNAFYENLEFLLEYVENPYFTDENVEKEKGIIIEELEMYQDRPYSRIMQTCMYNSLIKHPMKYPVIGTREDIKRTTKEDLYRCYNTFYHPSNMFVVVTGNVEPDMVFKVIEEHENKRKLVDEPKIELKKYKEPNYVEKEKEVIEMDVTIPKVAITYKISKEKFKKFSDDRIYSSIMSAFDLKLGSTSLFNENLRNLNLITDSIELLGIDVDSHLIVIVAFETKEIDKVMKLVMDEIKDLRVTNEDFERRKKVAISSLLFMTDNIFKINTRIVSDIIKDGKVEYQPIKKIKEFKLEEANSILKDLDLSNKTICIINPEKQ